MYPEMCICIKKNLRDAGTWVRNNEIYLIDRRDLTALSWLSLIIQSVITIHKLRKIITKYWSICSCLIKFNYDGVTIISSPSKIRFKIKPLHEEPGLNYLSLSFLVPQDLRFGGPEGVHSHIWAIWVCAAVRGMVFKQFTPTWGI